MGGRERAKGARGERSVARAFASKGNEVTQLQRNRSDTSDLLVNGQYTVDSKNQERLQLPLWLRQVEEAKLTGTIGVVAFPVRRRWYVCLLLDEFAEAIVDRPEKVV